MDSTAEELNSAIIRRYLRVFETEDIAELTELVDEDVIAHGAGQTVQGRHLVEDSVRTPGLSECRMGIEDFFAARDRVTVAFTMTYKHDRAYHQVAAGWDSVADGPDNLVWAVAVAEKMQHGHEQDGPPERARLSGYGVAAGVPCQACHKDA